MAQASVTIGLSAVVMALVDGELAVLTVQPSQAQLPALPSGPFDPAGHRTFELALRAFVAAQTGLDLGYVEQLYTFGDAGRDAPQATIGDTTHGEADRVVSVGYLALSPLAGDVTRAGVEWRPWTDFFPYEDWRLGRPEVIDSVIAPAVSDWAGRSAPRRARAEALFALTPDFRWREDRVLERYELLYEMELAPEAGRDHQAHGPDAGANLGQPMLSDHRRILATGLGRLRGKLRYRPVALDLVPETFTLSRLQRAVEAVTGLLMHKQNFRRGVERTGLVEATCQIEPVTGGRPAELFRRRPVAAGDAQALGLPLPVLR
ncbi:NAD regulator [Brevundimonas sp.]|uniref:NUDIX hydrolase n=1 Tax=Brevundimonas sp. TaxID=1871086 RepID=UPI0025DF7B90|nr:NAD regulator [Brevundimonas sp.]